MATLTGTETETTTAAQRPRRWRREKYNRKEALAGLLFISPWIIGFSVFTVISMTWSLRLSFSDYDLATNSGEPVGFDNYRLLLDDPKVLTSLGNTFFYVLLAVPLEMILALALASLLASVRRGAGCRSAAPRSGRRRKRSARKHSRSRWSRRCGRCRS